ncbi:hypothetical protein L210DRAFT_934954 [Boletus edulis BED1]|uniref:Uncharacterized protein n=1 Tax=Boletus edulis BED1 TaxID=1328754 RepID=A0AAD4GE83_BOLED|nr:hypothetical protein L210DRAFT_934954 [Boletus edulis BED1]
MQPRKHIHIAFKTISTPIIWISCQWEFINDIRGAAVGKFYNYQNGTWKHILHCDGSDTNAMFVVQTLNKIDVVSDWPKVLWGPWDYIKQGKMLCNQLGLCRELPTWTQK